MNSGHILHRQVPDDYSVDSSIFLPSLLRGEVAQGFWMTSYVPQVNRYSTLNQHSYNRLQLERLL
jgi:hypothetical protein